MNYSIVTYRGIEIKIDYEQDTQNPFEEWDGCMPLMSLGGYGGYDYSKGDILDYLRSFLTYNQVKRNQTKILNLIDYNVVDFKNDFPLNEFDRTEQIQDDLLYDWLEEDMKNKVSFCEAFNIKHYSSTSRGYSQSDWANVFICWTPEFEKITGMTYKSITEKDFESAFRLYSDWAWGDVFIYCIEDLDVFCGGYYGDDFENNGLLEYAKVEIDYYLKNQQKEKENKLKILIKNNVPLQKREQLLN